ncbi:hypothetical protein GGX14DRAFT_422151 [Mycena pura]|uniref:Copper acquisition factor BIM1-like domain-containing protein n=1 Tax=Mycena pura TaxID=153505 RepID=A0AAD6YPS1_9AGAR|nr:hypothetical protein GGX14DRAFT_422151 [Mycena pura]
MLASTSFVFASLISLTSAHFQLAFPAPRGVFVMNDEPNFCDGYNNPAANRTVFPLSNGVVSLNSEHPKWAGARSRQTDFNNVVVPIFQDTGEGLACFTLDFSKTATSLTDGQNVTIQVEFNGGDGNLFQCADLTLSANATVPANTCSNVTIFTAPVPSSTAPSSPSSSSPSSSSPSSSSPPSGSAVGRLHSSCLGIALGVLGLAAIVA